MIVYILVGSCDSWQGELGVQVGLSGPVLITIMCWLERDLWYSNEVIAHVVVASRQFLLWTTFIAAQ